MKIQKISFFNSKFPSFKNQQIMDNWDDDYGTYYNCVSIKDAFISSTVLSGIFLGIGSLIANESEISSFLANSKNNLFKFIKKVRTTGFNKIV